MAYDYIGKGTVLFVVFLLVWFATIIVTNRKGDWESGPGAEGLFLWGPLLGLAAAVVAWFMLPPV